MQVLRKQKKKKSQKKKEKKKKKKKKKKTCNWKNMIFIINIFISMLNKLFGT